MVVYVDSTWPYSILALSEVATRPPRDMRVIKILHVWMCQFSLRVRMLATTWYVFVLRFLLLGMYQYRKNMGRPSITTTVPTAVTIRIRCWMTLIHCRFQTITIQHPHMCLGSHGHFGALVRKNRRSWLLSRRKISNFRQAFSVWWSMDVHGGSLTDWLGASDYTFLHGMMMQIQQIFTWV